MSAVAISRLELLRFLRKASNARAVIMVASGLFLTLVAAAALSLVSEDLVILERTRYVLLACECCGLVITAYLFMGKAISFEVDNGSLPLLFQTPVPVARILIGKAAGIAAILVIMHSIFISVLMLPTPFMRRPWWALLLELGGIWLLAACSLPEAAMGEIEKLRGGRRYTAFRIATNLRFVMFMVFLQAVIPVEARERGVNFWDVLVSYWTAFIWLRPGEHAGAEIIGPTTLIGVVLGWQLLSVLILWFAFTRRRLTS